MRKYFFNYLGSVQNTLTFRGPIILWAIGSLVSLIAIIAVWFAASGGTTFGSYTKNELISYYILALVLQWSTSWMPFYWLKDEIKDGSIVGNTLLKPVSLFGRALSGEAGWHTISTPIGVAVGLLVLLFLHNYFVPPPGGLQIFLLALSIVQSTFIVFTFSMCMALLAFWLTNINTLDGIYWSLRFIIGGQVIPITFLTGSLLTAAIVLPFRYMVSFPLEIYFNKLSSNELLIGFMIGLFWSIFLFVLYKILLTKGIKAYTAFGN